MSETKKDLFEKVQSENQIESTPLKFWNYKDQDGLDTTVFSSQKGLLEFPDVQTACTYRDEKVKEIVGVKDTCLASHIYLDASEAIKSLGQSTTESNNIILQSLHDIQPKNSIEARLIVQGTTLYVHAMKNLKRAGNASQLDHIEALTNLSIKLIRVHNETIEALSRYRRGGEQKVTVQHTVVADKAIVNNFTGVRVPSKNRGDTPCSTNYAEQNQDPTTIDHVDSQPWPMEDVVSTVEKVPVQKQRQAKST